MSRPGRRPAAVRGGLAALVLGLVVLCAAAGRLAERALVDGRHVELGLLQLRLAYNTGAAFSIGAGLPLGVLLVVTAIVTLAVAGYTWRHAPAADWVMRLGLAAILAGAVANLIDRADDGAVIDYLHTGWWPTFNLPDTFITLGGSALVLAALRTTSMMPPTDDTAPELSGTDDTGTAAGADSPAPAPTPAVPDVASATSELPRRTAPGTAGHATPGPDSPRTT